MTYRQFLLTTDNRTLWAWLSDDPRLIAGTQLTLEDHPEPHIIWTVTTRSKAVVDHKPRQAWKVGGLST